ncbi:hypothetical protein T439DRAFT_321240 [Meredithblackwellia eburnea MCA 4105]
MLHPEGSTTVDNGLVGGSATISPTLNSSASLDGPNPTITPSATLSPLSITLASPSASSSSTSGSQGELTLRITGIVCLTLFLLMILVLIYFFIYRQEQASIADEGDPETGIRANEGKEMMWSDTEEEEEDRRVHERLAGMSGVKGKVGRALVRRENRKRQKEWDGPEEEERGETRVLLPAEPVIRRDYNPPMRSRAEDWEDSDSEVEDARKARDASPSRNVCRSMTLEHDLERRSRGHERRTSGRRKLLSEHSLDSLASSSGMEESPDRQQLGRQVARNQSRKR